MGASGISLRLPATRAPRLKVPFEAAAASRAEAGYGLYPAVASFICQAYWIDIYRLVRSTPIGLEENFGVSKKAMRPSERRLLRNATLSDYSTLSLMLS
jgi:hypothetical protein